MLPLAREARRGEARRGEVEYGLPSVYSTLLEELPSTLQDRSGVFLAVRDPASCGGATPPLVVGQRAHCVACGTRFATAEDMAVVIEQLKQAGLPRDHLIRFPDCRDVDRGWTPGVVTLEVTKLR